MIVYINPNDFKCYTEYQEGYLTQDIPAFDNSCKELIEGYRYIPSGYTWENKGTIYEGETMFPWVDYNTLMLHQANYQSEQLKEANEAIDKLLLIIGGNE